MWRNPETGEKTEGGTGEFIIFSLHVDDFYCITDSDRLKKELIDFLKLKYKNIKVHEGKTLTYLGVLVSAERNGDVVLDLPAYKVKLSEMLPHLKEKKSRVPYTAFMSPRSDDDDTIDANEYLRYVGAYNFLATRTRPNNLYTMSRLAQACSKPTKLDMRRVEKAWKHLNATSDQVLRFSSEGEMELIAHVDSSHNCYDDG